MVRERGWFRRRRPDEGLASQSNPGHGHCYAAAARYSNRSGSPVGDHLLLVEAGGGGAVGCPWGGGGVEGCWPKTLEEMERNRTMDRRLL
jgi:hypothetical protein